MLGEASTTRRMPPPSAACDTTLPFTTGGDAEWFAQTTEYNNDGDAAQSGAIVSSEETWMQTTVEGEGDLTFRYKMDSASGDTLRRDMWAQGYRVALRGYRRYKAHAWTAMTRIH